MPSRIDLVENGAFALPFLVVLREIDRAGAKIDNKCDQTRNEKKQQAEGVHADNNKIEVSFFLLIDAIRIDDGSAQPILEAKVRKFMDTAEKRYKLYE